LPIAALLARIRKLIPRQKDDHYEEILRGFSVGALRSPSTPMSDAELARAIGEFLKRSHRQPRSRASAASSTPSRTSEHLRPD
jgi:hypothetical protein